MAGLQPGFAFTPMPIQLGDLIFGQVDSEGVHWHCATLSGWDSPDVRSTVTAREAAHGSWMGPTTLAERVVTLAGKAFAPSVGALDRAVDRLLEAASITDTTLTVMESVPKQATVRRSGKVLAERLTGTVLDWSVMVTAPDPRRYGTELRTVSTGLPVTTGGLTPPFTVPFTVASTTVAGAIIAANEGSFGTCPLLTVTGPVTTPTITVQYPDGTASTLAYASSLLAGEVLVLDTDAHTAMLSGTASRRRYLSGPWPQIPPASTVRLEFRSAIYDAAATLTATWRSAWI